MTDAGLLAHLAFPITDLGELIEAIAAADAAYAATADPGQYTRAGVAGLLAFLRDAASAAADEVEGKPLVCPSCGAGIVQEVHVSPLELDGFLCDGCDAFWMRRWEISANGAVSYTAFLEALGQAADRRGVQVRGPIRQ